MRRIWISATVLVTAGAALGGACGGASNSMAVQGNDASTPPATGDDLASDAAVADDGPGNAAFTMPASPDGGSPLQARIQVTGNGGVCGGCDVVVAQAQGGVMPYAYTWSDPSWQGPGPFQLCPDKATPITLSVTDSSGTSGEIAQSNQTAQAATTAECVASDGGAAPGALNGCMALGSTSSLEDAALAPDASVECTADEVEAGVAWADGGAVASVATPLPVTLLAGHTYSASYDRLLPIVLGQAVTVEIWGSTEPDICQADQKLFTLNLDGSIFDWHESFCFTPDRDYHYAITRVYIQGTLFFFNALAVSTLCDTCTM